MKRRGRPVMGAIGGLFLGLFLALDLAIFKVMPPSMMTVVGLPLAGLVIGLFLGLAAPFRRGSAGKADPA